MFEIASLFSAVAGVLAAFISYYFSSKLADTASGSEANEPRALEDELLDVSTDMRASVKRLRRVEAELEARRQAAEELRIRVERDQELASVNAEQAQAIQNLLDSRLEAHGRTSRRDTWLAAAASFAAGALLTFAVTVWIG